MDNGTWERLQKHRQRREEQPRYPRAEPVCTKPVACSPGRSEPHRSSAGYQSCTFGCWEIVNLTVQRYDMVILQLIQEGVHVCTVTGLWVQKVAHHVQNHAKYRWYGSMTLGHQAVGVLVRTDIDHQVHVQSPGVTTGDRMLICKIGGIVVQGVYALYVGKCSAHEQRRFLSTVVDNHVKCKNCRLEAVVWTMGDFNLRGLPRGITVSRPPLPQQHRMSAWLVGKL